MLSKVYAKHSDNKSGRPSRLLSGYADLRLSKDIFRHSAAIRSEDFVSVNKLLNANQCNAPQNVVAGAAETRLIHQC